MMYINTVKSVVKLPLAIRLNDKNGVKKLCKVRFRFKLLQRILEKLIEKLFDFVLKILDVLLKMFNVSSILQG